jgi:hypothetical protein
MGGPAIDREWISVGVQIDPFLSRLSFKLEIPLVCSKCSSIRGMRSGPMAETVEQLVEIRVFGSARKIRKVVKVVHNSIDRSRNQIIMCRMDPLGDYQEPLKDAA